MKLKQLSVAGLIAALLFVAAASAEVTITRLDEPVETGEFVQLFVSGIPRTELAKATVKHYPRERTVFMPAQTWAGEPFIFFKASIPGKYLVWVDVTIDGVKAYVEAEIAVEGDSPNPPPPPPTPNPYEEPTEDWKTAVSAILQSRLKPTASESLARFFSAVASNVKTDGAISSGELRAAMTSGQTTAVTADYKAALIQIMNDQIGRADRDVTAIAEVLLPALSWATWEAGHHE